MDPKVDVKTIELTDELELMLSCAMRYCMGRRTYIVDDFCKYIESVMKDLSITELERMQEDFDNHSSNVDTGFASWGDDCDKQNWMKFKEKLDLEISLHK